MTLNFVLMALIQAVFFLAVYSSVRKKKLALAYPVRPVKWFIALSAFLSSVVCILCFALPAQWFYLLLEKSGYSFSDPVSFETPVNLALGILVTVFLAPCLLYTSKKTEDRNRNFAFKRLKKREPRFDG